MDLRRNAGCGVFLWLSIDLSAKSRAQLASPQLRPTSPINWGRGMTGCRDYAQAPDWFRGYENIFVHS
jgi:hypothetical protein